MELQFLGTGAGMPSKERNTTAIMLKLLEERGTMWLFDCGEATQHRILHTPIKPRKIEKIFITHLHGDHIFGLPGLLGSRSFLGGTEPLTIYGPAGIREWIETTIRLSGTHLTYALQIVEVDEGIVFEDEQFIVRAAWLQHVIPCVGYRVEQKPLDGALDVEKARALGVPKGPLLGQLKRGKDVTLENGQVVRAVDVVAPAKEGAVVTILGDTTYCEAAIQLAQHADVVVHEATFDDATKHLAAQYGHATNVEAAHVAQQAKAKHLLLSHISARFVGEQVTQLEEHAAAVFPNTYVAQDLAAYRLHDGNITKL